EVLRAEVARDRAKAVVAGEPAAATRLEATKGEIAVVVHDEHRVGLELEEPHRRGNRATGVVHEGLRLQERDLVAVDPDVRKPAVELRLPRAAVPPRELVDDHVADVVTVARVLAAGIAETSDEQVVRRAVAAGPQPHELLALVAAGVA